MIHGACVALLLDVVVGAAAIAAAGQGRGGQPPAPRSAHEAAPIDLTGYWVAVVTQDWRWRMVTPAKGDYGSIPITLDAKKVGDSWDPAKDEAAGEQCKAYGAPALMAVPTRLRITWQDENTLKMEADAGTQTRLFRFGNSTPPAATATSQGESRAEWELPPEAQGTRPRGGSLKVVTKRLRPGYLRKNGVPFSASAVMTEFWDLATERNGDHWITITSTVEDSKYLREPWVTALHFKKESDGARWDPAPCSAR
jgi:hypothetical protein